MVSTNCKGCGVHLRVEKKVVTVSSLSNPFPSAVYPESRPVETPTSTAKSALKSLLENFTGGTDASTKPEGPTSDSPRTFAGHQIQHPPAQAAQAAPQEPEIRLGLGQKIGISRKSTTPKPPQEFTSSSSSLTRLTSPPPSAPLKRELPPQSAPGTPSTTFQKMRQQGFKQQHFKEITCFDCHHLFTVGRSAKNANCPKCSMGVCLEDFDINQVSNHPILTRGDVNIRKTGNLNTTSVRCRNLTVQGLLSASIECSGTLHIKSSGTIIGEVTCAELIVDKGSDIHFYNQVVTTSANIQGRIFATIHCDGKISIGAHGYIHGDVATRSISIDPGGELDGGMSILSHSSKPPGASAETIAPAQEIASEVTAPASLLQQDAMEETPAASWESDEAAPEESEIPFEAEAFTGNVEAPLVESEATAAAYLYLEEPAPAAPLEEHATDESSASNWDSVTATPEEAEITQETESFDSNAETTLVESEATAESEPNFEEPAQDSSNEMELEVPTIPSCPAPLEDVPVFSDLQPAESEITESIPQTESDSSLDNNEHEEIESTSHVSYVPEESVNSPSQIPNTPSTWTPSPPSVTRVEE